MSFNSIAFSGYSAHMSDLDNIANEIVNTYFATGETEFSIDLTNVTLCSDITCVEDLTNSDRKYINQQVRRRLSI